MRRREKSLLTSVSSLKQHTAFILQHLQASVCVTINVDVEIVTTAGGFRLFPAAELSEHHRGDLYTPLLSVLTAKRLSFNSGVKSFSTFSTTDSSRQFMWRDVGSEHFSPTSWDLHTSHIRRDVWDVWSWGEPLPTETRVFPVCRIRLQLPCVFCDVSFILWHVF